jgi:hypothetical protein
MASERLQGLLPTSKGVSHIFDVPAQRYNIRVTSIGQIAQLMSLDGKRGQAFFTDTLEAGVANLALRGADRTMTDLGSLAYQSLRTGYAQTYLTNNVTEAAKQLGYPEEFIRNTQPDTPFTVIESMLPVRNPRDQVTSIIPFEFLLATRESPVDAMAFIVSMCSVIRDGANKRALVDPELIGERAAAFEARYIRQLMEKEPLQPIPEFYRQYLEQYPEEQFKELNYVSMPMPLDPRAN